MQTIANDRLVRIPEAAKMLGVSRRTLYRMFDEGQLAGPVKVRGCSGVMLSELNRYMEQVQNGVRS